MRCDSGPRVGNVFESKRRNRKWTENQRREGEGARLEERGQP